MLELSCWEVGQVTASALHFVGRLAQKSVSWMSDSGYLSCLFTFLFTYLYIFSSFLDLSPLQ